VCVCVFVCVCACACVCVSVWVYVFVFVCKRESVCACARAQASVGGKWRVGGKGQRPCTLTAHGWWRQGWRGSGGGVPRDFTGGRLKIMSVVRCVAVRCSELRCVVVCTERLSQIRPAGCMSRY